MAEEKRTPIVHIAAVLGTPNTCPVCTQDWRKAGCTHQVCYAEGLSVAVQLLLIRKLEKRDAEAWPPRMFDDVWVPVAEEYKYWPEKEAVQLNDRIKTTHRATEDRDWQQPSKRRWGVTGTVINRHDGHGICYVVRHDDGSEAGYDPREVEKLVDGQ